MSEFRSTSVPVAPDYDPQAKQNLIREVGFDRHFKAGSWADYNRQFFDGLAEKYDATCVVHSLGTKARMDRDFVDQLSLQAPKRILDVACGSGDISILLARRFPEAEVIGLDAAPRMLAVAGRKAAGIGNLLFMQGDALALPFSDACFDAVTISYGLRNLTDLRAGLAEFRRVTRPGGVVSSVDQGKPHNALFNLIYRIQFQMLGPVLGKLLFHRGEFNSFRYLPKSNQYFPDQRMLVGMFQAAGFTDVALHEHWWGAVAQQTGRVRDATRIGPR